MTTKEKAAVMQAYIDGKRIQVYSKRKGWVDFDGTPTWKRYSYKYRVKPELKEPTYRPYNDFAEFLVDWEKHRGWVIDKSTCKCRLVNTFDLDCANSLLTNYTWADDGSLCGVLVTE